METLSSGLVIKLNELKSLWLFDQDTKEYTRVSVLKIAGHNLGNAVKLQIDSPRRIKIVRDKPRSE
jgi:hypothetical protein